MRVPTFLRCWFLGCELRTERERLAGLMEHEAQAQVQYAHTRSAIHKALLAESVADLAHEIARVRAGIADRRRRMARLRNGMPEEATT